ncbi:MAG: glycosyltransferase [Pseudomonadota bacterium]
MKILHTVPHVCKEASGPSYSVSRLCDQLGGSGHEVSLYTIDAHRRADAHRYRHETFASTPVAGKLGLSRGFSAALHDAAPTADLIHNHGLWMMPNVYPGDAARRSRTPLIVSPRGTFSPVALQRSRHVKQAFWWLKQRRAIETAACLHATSEQEYLDIRAFGLRQPVAGIPNGVDIPEALEERKSGERRTLLFLGRIHPIKGLDMLLEAWEQVSQEHAEWDLVIAGSDADGYRQELDATVRRNKLNRVRFAGPQYGDAKHAAYCAADLYILPSRTENFGHTVAEALARATPVITTTGTPWAPVVSEGCGWCVEPTVEAINGALKQGLKAAPADLAAMGARGRGWMRRDFSWEAVASQMTQVYAWCAGEGPRPDCVRAD